MKRKEASAKPPASRSEPIPERLPSAQRRRSGYWHGRRSWSGSALRSALAEVMQGRTTIIIAHRPATIALADRVVLLDGGRVVADGTHEELLATCSRYREVLARAAADERAGVVDDEELPDNNVREAS